MEVSFRTKVLGVVVPALLVLLVLGAVVVGRSLDDSTGAGRDRTNAEIGRAAMSVRDEVQIESRLAVLVVNFADGTGRKEFIDQQKVTDAAVADFSRLADGGSVEPALTATLTRARASLADKLAKARPQITSGAGSTVMTGVVGLYDDLVIDVSSTAGAFAGSAVNTKLSARANELIGVVDVKDAFGRQLLTPLQRLDGTVLNAADGALYKQAAQATEVAFNRVLASARPETATAIDDFRSSKLFGDVLRSGTEYATDGTVGKIPRFTGPEWLQLASGASAGLDQVEVALFDQFLDVARQEESHARRQATFYGILTVLGIAAAAAGAWVVGRSLTRRLLKVTSAAHTIAVDRLPEVLEALRNPTPEAVASAVPQIPSPGSDEVGQLATDFNVVLRTAIETSLEHAQRRAATLTNLLVNLGRRNQALIDRQLELVDQLESDQPDQKTLAGLFRLDHMITRQRRNAESLLVLAGSRRSRSWTESLPISDVLQGAISEVAQMDRVALEIQPGNDLVFGGGHAVDLSHLVAELVENATAYSSPSTRVTVRVQRNAVQYRIWVIDSGVGMADDDLESANLRVTNPPEIDEITTDQVGFQVVGRLAQRIGARVRLQNNPAGGVAASIDLPVSLFEFAGDDLGARRSGGESTVGDSSKALPILDDAAPDMAWAEMALEALDDETLETTPAHLEDPFDALLRDSMPITDSVPTGPVPPVPTPATPGEITTPVAHQSGYHFDRQADAGPASLPKRERRSEPVDRSIRQLLPNARNGGQQSSGPRPDIAAAMIGDATNSAAGAPPALPGLLTRRLGRSAALATSVPATPPDGPTAAELATSRGSASGPVGEGAGGRSVQPRGLSAAAAASEGLFRRLPAHLSANADEDAALQRRRNLSMFTKAVDAARDEQTDDPTGVNL